MACAKHFSNIISIFFHYFFFHIIYFFDMEKIPYGCCREYDCAS